MKLPYLVLERNLPLWLTDYPDYYRDEPGHAVRRATPTDLTAALIANYLDQKCEDCNRHDYVGAHKALAKLIARELGTPAADVLMQAILRKGGLHKMAGCE